MLYNNMTNVMTEYDCYRTKDDTCYITEHDTCYITEHDTCYNRT